MVPMANLPVPESSLEHAQAAAAYVAARLRGDKMAMAAIGSDIGTLANLVAGLMPLAEQLCIELAARTERSPATVASDVAVLAATGLAAQRRGHPSTKPTGEVD